MGVQVQPLVAALEHGGFESVSSRRGRAHLRRRVGHRDDHAVVASPPTASFPARLLRRPRWVDEVVIGQVWRLVEQAFSRPVPTAPELPSGVHVATVLDPQLVRLASTPWDLVVAIDGWCDERTSPADALADGLPTDPLLRLDFAVVARDRAAGLAAAESVRSGLVQLPPAERWQVQRHLDLAESRLPD